MIEVAVVSEQQVAKRKQLAAQVKRVLTTLLKEGNWKVTDTPSVGSLIGQLEAIKLIIIPAAERVATQATLGWVIKKAREDSLNIEIVFLASGAGDRTIRSQLRQALGNLGILDKKRSA